MGAAEHLDQALTAAYLWGHDCPECDQPIPAAHWDDPDWTHLTATGATVHSDCCPGCPETPPQHHNGHNPHSGPPTTHGATQPTGPQVIGLDLSLTETGIATTAGQTTIKTSPDTRLEDRLLTIRDSIYRTISDAGSNPLVVIENYVTRSPAASILGMVHGVIRVHLHEHHIPYVLIPPASLKRYATGKGNATKPDIRVAILQRYSQDIRNDNACDAFVLRAMGLDALGTPLAALPQTHRQALDKICWPTEVT